MTTCRLLFDEALPPHQQRLRWRGLSETELAALTTAARRLGLVLEERKGALVSQANADQWQALATVLVGDGHPALARQIQTALRPVDQPSPDLVLPRTTLRLSQRPHLVGILNATPDSFHDHGRYFDLAAALDRAAEMVDHGADVIEIGGQSARVGASIPVAEELRRVLPLIERLSGDLQVPLAIDTWRAAVAARAVGAGVQLLNDISGLARPAMARVAAASGAALVVMHIVGRPKVDHSRQSYQAVVDEVLDFLEERTERAVALGVPRERLAVDPGFSFAKQPQHDLEILRRLGELRSLGYPIYLATSRKTYLRQVLGLPTEELLEATEAAVAYGVLQGASLIRAHDVAAMRRAADMAWRLRRSAPLPALPQQSVA